MFNNVALDVFIGLVFIYLLYSLLATAINEFVSMIFAYRHRMLENAIEQMLDGKNYSYYWWNKLGNIFFWLYHYIKTEAKSGDKKNVVSENEITRKNFFTTENINTQSSGDTPTKIYRNTLNKKAALFAANIINHPLYRRSAEGSILYKKPAYLTASAFSDILVDVLGNRKNNINSNPVLMNDIKTFVNNELNENPNLKNILNIYIQQANGDIQKFKLLIENWFDDTMNRVTGWYKRQSTKILFVIGFLLAMGLNVSTIDIVHRLYIDKDLREAMAQSASAYVKNVKNENNDSAAIKKKIEQIQVLYDSTVAPVNTLMGLGWEHPKNDTTIGHWYFNLPYYLVPHKWKKYYFKVRYIIRETAKRPRSLFGFLITAFAITLGAPFWFDLLNRFVNIRAGGNKPSEDSPKPAPAKSITEKLYQRPAINSFA